MNKAEAFKNLIQEAYSTKQKLLLSAVYLFSSKGYANVGIRELTRSVNIKESAFYNHFKGKDDLFSSILDKFIELSTQQVFSGVDLEEIMATGDIKRYLSMNMQIYMNIANSPLYFTLLQIIMMESYTNEKAWALVRRNDYPMHLEKLLEDMKERKMIRDIDEKSAAASYYYGVKGIMQDFLLQEVWDEQTSGLKDMMNRHIDLFVEMMKRQ